MSRYYTRKIVPVQIVSNLNAIPIGFDHWLYLKDAVKSATWRSLFEERIPSHDLAGLFTSLGLS